MSKVVISVENLGKRYLVGHNTAQSEHRVDFRELISRNVRSIARKTRDMLSGRPLVQGDAVEEFWALNNVSFEVRQGERLGIIGLNGAGKSTLLKILSRITEPTKGRVRITGRVASLLEVGTGFHPEFTGRENIFLCGALLGMTKMEVRRQFDAIVAFAEVEKFLDTPVKHYSSGMYVRLAFAVAAHLESEVLIIDEVLAVGDSRFQRKCLERLDTASSSGRTVIFVSHNTQAISTLTNRCLVLANGQKTFEGNSSEAIFAYYGTCTPKSNGYKTQPSITEPRVISVIVTTSEPNGNQDFGKPISVEFIVSTPYAIDGAALAFHICDEHRQSVVHLLHLDHEQPFCRHAGEFKLVCVIPYLRLYPGNYSLNVHLAESASQRKLQTLEEVCSFQVVALNQVREYYWYPNNAKYVEDAYWELNR